jgi:LacI family transcriptional regulator
MARMTINDVAKKANTSKATVSLVLNGKDNRISNETRDIVLQAANEIGYRPNRIARSLTQSRTKTLGLIIPDIRNTFFAEIAKGVEDEAYSMGHNVFLCNSDNIQEKEVHHITGLLDWGVDGIILDMAADGAYQGKDTFRLLKSEKLPVILVDRNVSQSNYGSVMLDNEQGAYEATAFLLKSGHKRIGCIAGALWLDCDKERLIGYKKALKEVNIKFDPDLLIEAGYKFEGGANASLQLYEKKVSAIFSFNDLMAYGSISALESKGINVPHDISIVGFDNIFFSQFRGVRLTTVEQPAYEMGKKAARYLMDLIDDATAPQKHFIFQPLLCVRETTMDYNLR